MLYFAHFDRAFFYPFRKTSHWSCFFNIFLFVKQNFVSYRNSSDCVNVSWKNMNLIETILVCFNPLQYTIIKKESNRSIGESRGLVWVGILWKEMNLSLISSFAWRYRYFDVHISVLSWFKLLVMMLRSISLPCVLKNTFTIAWFVCYTIILLK